MSICGAILVGGESRRMGKPKHSVRLADGRTMMQAVASALRGSCDTLAIIGLRDAKSAMAARDLFPNAALIHDTRPGEGPLAGIEALLQTNLSDTYIICSCDMAMLTRDVIAALATPCDEATAILHIDGEPTPRPLPCRVHASALPTVTKLLDHEQRAVRFLHREANAKVIHAPAEWADALADVNTPSDLASANAQLVSSLAPKTHRRSRSKPERPGSELRGRPSR